MLFQRLSLISALSALIVAILWPHINQFREHVTRRLACFVPDWFGLRDKCLEDNFTLLHQSSNTHPRFSHQRLIRKTERPVS